MQKEQVNGQIRDILIEIDELLTRECFFCGSILIDMIDNDIEMRNIDIEPDNEFEKEAKNQMNNEWDIE